MEPSAPSAPRGFQPPTMAVTVETLDSNTTLIKIEGERPASGFDVRLLVPHILLASVLILLLMLSFIQYHIKYRRKQSHAHYQEYLQLVQRSRVRRVSIPMTKVMRRFSQGQSLGNQVYFQDGHGHVIGVLHKLATASKSDAVLASNHRDALDDSPTDFHQQKRPSSVSLPPPGSSGGRTVSFYFPSDSSDTNERTELTNDFV